MGMEWMVGYVMWEYQGRLCGMGRSVGMYDGNGWVGYVGWEWRVGM